jgi:hypothetical protein
VSYQIVAAATMKMAICRDDGGSKYTETSANLYTTKRRNVPEDSHLHRSIYFLNETEQETYY